MKALQCGSNFLCSCGAKQQHNLKSAPKLPHLVGSSQGVSQENNSPTCSQLPCTHGFFPCLVYCEQGCLLGQISKILTSFFVTLRGVGWTTKPRSSRGDT